VTAHHRFGQSARLAAVQAPIIPNVGQFIAETPGTISLGQGMVSWGPPPEALTALARLAQEPDLHRYGAVEGDADLVEVIERKLAAENGIRTRPDSVVFVTAGGNMAFLNALLAVCDVGDEVILLAPFYFNHEMALVMAGVQPVIVPTGPGYQPDPDRIAAAITPRTRAVVTISPNNPSGAVYPEATLRAINAACEARGVFHVHDEVYEYFTYDGHRHFSPGALAGAAAHTISLFSLSKAYGFAGWRIGYMVVPVRLAEAVQKIQDTNLICPPRVSQVAAGAALRVGRSHCDARRPQLEAARQVVLETLSARPDLYAPGPAEGAFYVLLDVATPRSPLDLVEQLVRRHRIAAIPGTTFGLGGCVLRVSYGALAADTAAEGVQRLADGLAALLTS
jgi:aspartate/methionine/tyrosine aminotransferase